MQATEERYQFASDNCAGICPEALRYLLDANAGYSPSYGEDEWTARASDLIREIFETDCSVYFCFTGTAANSMAIGHLCDSYHSVLCHAFSHVETDECGAPEFFTNGTKIILLSGLHGKVNPDAVRETVERRKDIHFPKPRVLSITQATELGTVYSLEELTQLGEVARECGLRIHMDGARFANAVVTLDLPPKAISWQAGVDVLCLGGAKNGMPCGEAVIFFDKAVAEEFDFRCKQAGQLASKMRFMAAPWVGMLESGVWLQNAHHSNECAEKMEKLLATIEGVTILHPRQANSVFAEIPPGACAKMHEKGWHFYNFIGTGGSRLMCSWETTERDIEAFVSDLRRC